MFGIPKLFWSIIQGMIVMFSTPMPSNFSADLFLYCAKNTLSFFVRKLGKYMLFLVKNVGKHGCSV
jgi:hypothetical protein